MKFLLLLVILSFLSCNSGDKTTLPPQVADTVTLQDSNGYTWSCPNNETSVDDCTQLGFQCGQVCEPLKGFVVNDVTPSGTCLELRVNALREFGTCTFDNLNFSCNSSGQLIASGGGINIQTGFFNNSLGTKFYCQNNPNDISDLFPPEVDLLLD